MIKWISGALLAVSLMTFAVPAYAQEAGSATESATESAPASPSAVVVAAQRASSRGAEEAIDKAAAARTLRDYYDMGGWIMHFLVALSIISGAVILERLWGLRRGSVIPRRFLQKLRDHSHRREMKQVLELCASSDNAIARVLRSGLLHFDQGLANMEDAVETSGQHEATVLRRNLPLLAALGNMATMMGLLGTVLGMIEAFELIAKTGTGDARVVASGIFQALITTAAGLMVGLFAIGFHSYLRRKVEVLEIDLEEKSFRMLEDLWVGREQGPRSDTPPAKA
ncbi:MAG: MotA/TolQ/ExbB proton channel family protein [bacterium]|nr:MotA/TolQ/ExbB proton channel family protein [bacterium]